MELLIVCPFFLLFHVLFPCGHFAIMVSWGHFNTLSMECFLTPPGSWGRYHDWEDSQVPFHTVCQPAIKSNKCESPALDILRSIRDDLSQQAEDCDSKPMSSACRSWVLVIDRKWKSGPPSPSPLFYVCDSVLDYMSFNVFLRLLKIQQDSAPIFLCGYRNLSILWFLFPLLQIFS